MEKQILHNIGRLRPYKAPGPDGILNVVLPKCADILVKPLTAVYNASLRLASYFSPWKVSTMIVLRKPGKPDYIKPKVYRPVTLISCMAKAKCMHCGRPFGTGGAASNAPRNTLRRMAWPHHHQSITPHCLMHQECLAGGQCHHSFVSQCSRRIPQHGAEVVDPQWLCPVC